MILDDQPSRLSQALDFLRRVKNLPNEINDLAKLPFGTGDGAEAENLYAALVDLDAVWNGSADNRARAAGEEFQQNVAGGAYAAGIAFGDFVQKIQNRLYALAHAGVKPPDCVLSQDFRFPPVIAVHTTDKGLDVPFIFAPVKFVPDDPGRRFREPSVPHDGLKGLSRGTDRKWPV